MAKARQSNEQRNRLTIIVGSVMLLVVVVLVGISAPQIREVVSSPRSWSGADTTRLLQLESCAEKVMCSLTFAEQSELDDLEVRKPSYLDSKIATQTASDNNQGGSNSGGGGFVEMLQEQAAQADN